MWRLQWRLFGMFSLFGNYSRLSRNRTSVFSLFSKKAERPASETIPRISEKYERERNVYEDRLQPGRCIRRDSVLDYRQGCVGPGLSLGLCLGHLSKGPFLHSGRKSGRRKLFNGYFQVDTEANPSFYSFFFLFKMWWSADPSELIRIV